MSQRYIGGLIYNPPGGFSGFFDGSGDYLTIADNIALDMEGSDFTIEGWIFPVVSSGGSVGVFSKRASGAVVGGVLLYYNGAGLTPSLLIGSGGSWVINQASSIAFGLGQWNHFAVVRNGTSFVLYINGVAGVSATSSSSVTDNSAAFAIGAWAADGTGAISASYFSNFRVVKGTALYTAAFTPPTGPLQAITNTSLLTCAYPTFRDGSSNNFTITVNGNTAVSTQNPFPQTQLPNPALGNQGNGVYSMSQYQALRSQNLWPAIDPWFDYVTLMLHGNGTNGAQNNTFLDSSTNNFTITRNGNTTQGTFTPYGSNWSNYFNGSSYLTFPNNSSLAFGTGAYTIEFWVNSSGPLSDSFILSGRAAIGTLHITYGGFGGTTPGCLRFVASSTITTGSVLISNGAWNHCAIVRDGSNNITLYVNGVSAATGTDTTNYTTTSGTWYINANDAGPTAGGAGYISNLRILKGTALYTSAFTPPTGPLTAITNTSLLTCQSNRFIDNSSNAFALTVNGSPSVQRFSPFNPTTPYAAGTIGGSGYFDGSGDYLSATTAASLGSGDFTVECWVYFTSAPGADTGNIICSYNYYTAGFNGNVVFRLGTSYGGRIFNGQTLVAEISGTFTWPLYTWTHVAWVRSGSTITLYKNGVSIGSMTASTNLSDFANGFVVGASRINGTVGEYSTCYISNLRMVAGTAVYTTTFTPPTAPLTAITNTSLLLNYTNGGIIDNAMMNDLETVGNAQISTSVSKFGGGSLAFDGNGDWLFGPANQNAALGTGDFTLEAWVYVTTFSTTTGFQAIFSNRNSNSAQASFDFGIRNSDRYLYFYNRNTDASTFSTSGLSGTNTWTHVAIVRVGSTITFYINGTSAGTVSVSTNSFGSSNVIYVGTNFNTTPDIYNGNIDDMRLTKYARYTANFTPQRSQWQDQ